MYARLVSELPTDKDWLYEVKFDGYRCVAGRDSTGVTLWSRRGNLFTNQFGLLPVLVNGFHPAPLLTARSSPWMKAGRFRLTFCNIIAQKHRRCSFSCSMCWHAVTGVC